MRFPQTFSSAATDQSHRPKIKGFLIDRKGTHFREDAINIKLKPDGNLRVCISVADIASAIDEKTHDLYLWALSQSLYKNNLKPFDKLDDISKKAIGHFKQKTSFFVGEYAPSVAISFDIDIVTGGVSNPDVYLARTLPLQAFTFEEANQLVVNPPENDFFDLFSLAAESYLSTRPFLEKNGRGGHGKTSSLYLQALTYAASQAMGMYAQQRAIPVIYAGHKAILHDDDNIFGVFNSVALAAKAIRKHNNPADALKAVDCKFVGVQYATTPIDDIETDSKFHVKFTSPLRLLSHFVNFLQISSHLHGQSPTFSPSDLDGQAKKLNWASGSRYSGLASRLARIAMPVPCNDFRLKNN
jgi:hypothetical protein